MSKSWPKAADPNDRADYTIEWTLDDGDTIVSSTWVIADDSPGISIVLTTFTDTSTAVWVTGGTAGDPAKLRNHITTAFTRQFDQTVTLKVKER